jgi:hypothetical protein
MATAAQVLANRANAQNSTGPKTAEGKQASSANSTKFGLFSAKNCVRPDEHEEYEAMCAGLLTTLNPVGHLEEMLAADIVRAAWRLRRCTVAEAELEEINRTTQANPATHSHQVPEANLDPLCHSATAHTQQAIDRARSQAISARRRAWADLEQLQNERFLRVELRKARLLDPTVDISRYGIAKIKKVVSAHGMIETSTRKFAEGRATEEFTMSYLRDSAEIRQGLAELNKEFNSDRPVSKKANRTQSAPPSSKATPRNAPCPCKSGLKYKRCCGENAPPVTGAQTLSATA